MIELKSEAIISVKKKDRIYSFHCENNSNLLEIQEVLFEITGFISNKLEEHKKLEESKEKEVKDVSA